MKKTTERVRAGAALKELRALVAAEPKLRAASEERTRLSQRELLRDIAEAHEGAALRHVEPLIASVRADILNRAHGGYSSCTVEWPEPHPVSFAAVRRELTAFFAPLDPSWFPPVGDNERWSLKLNLLAAL